MAQTPEGAVKAAIKKVLTNLDDCWHYMPVQNGMGVVGIPDIIGVLRGRMFGIECKAPGKENNVTPNQARTLDLIREAGGIAFVASNVETVRESLLKEVYGGE